ncbi:transpeptidase involved in peptidoglycan synthesis (penicillin-binding protein 2) [Haemophilus influenzae]|uniref:Transpeptidase involved in peptidoglycan synthesis (Penicillin-binding protein 2) n=1 Tax=Haemophilus influenzae TaxID=727 RepID=A0A2X1PR32_HAEIF|nr:transpeptidase involved in peptidoglycan synthesis (penicillin-binding protein 2) [Haemophilus influenzae]
MGILLLTGVLFTNIYQLQIVNFDTYQTRSNGNRIKLLPLPPTRGLIYDRYGKLLAENLTFFGLYIVPEKTENLDRTLDELRYIVGLTDNDIENFKKERRRGTRYTPILLKPNLTEETNFTLCGKWLPIPELRGTSLFQTPLFIWRNNGAYFGLCR